MGFSLSRFLPRISEDSVAADRWICESLSLSQLKCIPMFQMAGALEMEKCQATQTGGDEMMKGSKRGGKAAKRHRCVCARAWTCTIMYINPPRIIGKWWFLYLDVTIIHSDVHLFSPPPPPPPQCSLVPFIYVATDKQPRCWLAHGGQMFGGCVNPVQVCRDAEWDRILCEKHLWLLRPLKCTVT